MDQTAKEQEKDKIKTYTLIVNGRQKEWQKHEISFKEVVILAYGTYETDTNPNIVYVVTFRYSDKKGGELVAGQTVKVKDGMIFDVQRADKS